MRTFLLVLTSLLSTGASVAQSVSALAPQELLDLRKSADAGDVNEQFDLGNRYYFGTEVPKDHDEGMTWLLKAAEHGDAEIQRSVGFICARARPRLDYTFDEKRFDDYQSFKQISCLNPGNLFIV